MKLIQTLFLLVILAGCGGDEIREVPDGVISRDTMVMVLAETHIINAKFQHREARRMKFTDLLKVEQLAMYDSLGISEEKVNRSMKFYLEDYGEMQKLHDQAMNIISERMALLKTQKPQLEGSEPEELEINPAVDAIQHLE